MNKSIAVSCLLVLACTLVLAHGGERNMQEVLEGRYKQLADTPDRDTGTLPVVSAATASADDIPDEGQDGRDLIAEDKSRASGSCKCEQQVDVSSLAPEPVVSKKKKNQKSPEKEPEAPLEAEIETIAVNEELEEVKAAETATEKPKPESEGKKSQGEKGGNKKESKKDKKRDKRDTKGGKSKNKERRSGKSKQDRKGKNKKSKK